MHGYVYIIRANGLYKIGSTQDLNRRLMQLRTACPFLERVQTITCYAYRETEKELHRLFARERVAGEWFVLSENDLDVIAATDWASFPAEISARLKVANLYERINQVIRDTPWVRETLRNYHARNGRRVN